MGIDFIGPITPASSSGNRFILTLSDYYTKWVDAVPLPSKHATGVAASLLKVHLHVYRNINILFVTLMFLGIYRFS